MIDNKYYTWLDVLSNLDFAIQEGVFPKNVGVEAYWDGLKILRPKGVDEKLIIEALNGVFRARFKDEDEGLGILLESPSIEEQVVFPIHIEDTETEIIPYPFKPTFKRPPLLTGNFQDVLNGREKVSKPKITAFFSFKGGVGRTLSTISLTKALSDKGKKVLLVDVDLEAPGITWMLNESERNFSLADFLALIHGSEDESHIINSAARYIKKQQYENIFILPAFRYKEQMQWLEIRPEHIATFSEDPFKLYNIFIELGKALECDNVVLDLRAGISELSSGWLLDPFVQKVFVTTLSSQSLSGTNMILETYSRLMKINGFDEIETPFLIFSQVQEAVISTYKEFWNDLGARYDFQDKNETKSLLIELRNTYISNFLSSASAGTQEFDSNSLIADELLASSIFVKEYESLRALPQQLDILLKNIELVKLDAEVYLGITKWLSLEENVSELEVDLVEARKLLSSIANDLIYAERRFEDNFLITAAIGKLIHDHKSQVPNVVIIGAKGAGKTFLYRQLVQSKNWMNFSKKAHVNSHLDAAIFPVIIPNYIDNKAVFKSYSEQAVSLIRGESPQRANEIIAAHIEQGLTVNLTTSEWRNNWLDYMAWSLGFQLGIKNASSDFIKLLQEKNIKLVGVVDGLEELFEKFHESEAQQVALSALIRDVPNWLESIPGQPLGLITFIRQDIISYAIKQNLGQFTDKYKDYKLNWNREEVLRLVYWIMLNYRIPGFFEGDISEDINTSLEDFNEEELVEKLYFLWGKRMAKNNSKEAYSHRWILGQLANLNYEIQSRDMVRFLSEAASRSVGETDNYKDRILLPVPIKDSVYFVGVEKIKEVKEENKSIAPIFNRLSTLIGELKFPCKQEDLRLFSDKDIKLLEDNGVLVYHKGDYYMAEIYRRGFNFEYSKRGRPKFIF